MPAPSYKVEVRKSAVLIVGESPEWVATFAKSLAKLPLEVLTSPTHVIDDYDLDYCLVLGGPLPQLGNFPTRLVYVQAYQRAGEVPSLPPGSRLLLYPEVIGENLVYTPSLDTLVQEAMTAKVLRLAGDGLEVYDLIVENALLDTVRDCLLENPGKRKTVLRPATPSSFLSLAYQIRSSLPFKLDIILGVEGQGATRATGTDIVEVEGAATDYIPSRVQSLAKTFSLNKAPSANKSTPSLSPTPQKPSTPTKLRRLSELATASPEFVPVPLPRSPRRKIKFKLPHFELPHSPLWTGVLLGLSLYLASLAFTLTVTVLTVKNLASSLSNFVLPTRSFLRLADLTSSYLEVNAVALSSLPLISKSTSIREGALLLGAYREGIKSLILASDLSDLGHSISSYVLNGGGGDIAKDLTSAILVSGELYNNLSLLDAALPPSPPNLLPDRYHGDYSRLKETLAQTRRAIITAKTLLSTAPDLLGLGGRRKYLVLLQNNMELRATGGFIGSFAILSLENGHLYDLPIYDVYQADGQLKGHVEPPLPIKEYLGEANWFLRDSNWDPDFPTSARRAEWFLQKTLGEDVQGTIGVNIYTLAAVLKALGGVKVPDYNETVTGDNIFERAEYYSEANFFPGSTGKKEFLSAVSSALFAKLSSADPASVLTLSRSLLQSIDEKNTTLSVFSSTSSQTFNALGWDGGLRDLPCPSLEGATSCFADYAMLVDSNLGVNKANYFLHRRLNMATTIDIDLNVSHKLSVIYENTATSSTWPAGAYKNYSRLYLPPASVVESVNIGGKVLGPKELTLYAEHGKTVAGFLVEVPVSSTVEVSVEYRLGGSLVGASPLYSFYWQKQPGTDQDPLTLTVNYPLFLRPLVVSPQGSLGTQQLQFTLANTTDRRVTVQFAK